MRSATCSRAAIIRPRSAASDDGHDVVVVAEFLDVVAPALLALLARADEVAALGLVFEVEKGGVEGKGAKGGGQGEDGAGEAADRPDESDQAATNESRLVRGRLCRIHAFRLLLEFLARRPSLGAADRGGL